MTSCYNFKGYFVFFAQFGSRESNVFCTKYYKIKTIHLKFRLNFGLIVQLRDLYFSILLHESEMYKRLSNTTNPLPPQHITPTVHPIKIITKVWVIRWLIIDAKVHNLASTEYHKCCTGYSFRFEAALNAKEATNIFKRSYLMYHGRCIKYTTLQRYT